MIEFDHDYRFKFMRMSFTEDYHIATKKDLLAWRSEWTKALGSWHSPYKAIVDCSRLSISQEADLKKDFELMIKYFEGLFLREIAGFGRSVEKNHSALPFPVFTSEEEVEKHLDYRGQRVREQKILDFRSLIQIENSYTHQTVEVSFLAPVTIDSKDKLMTLKDKLINNLMTWHSAWFLIYDCQNLNGIDPEFFPLYENMRKFLSGFFLKKTVGYNIKRNADGSLPPLPFEGFLSRHKAMAQLGSEHLLEEKVQCQSRK